MSEASKRFTNACIVRVDLQTNCPQGGDSGHGGRTTIRFVDEGSTDMKGHAAEGEIMIDLGGDAEPEVFADAFEWAAEEIRRLIRANRESS